ncbi:MAG: hypothetical protein SFV81_10745, partial [Pirellulaceae bacterium]|nr:hypothetical protein [Pirellulaceae bacterium]
MTSIISSIYSALRLRSLDCSRRDKRSRLCHLRQIESLETRTLFAVSTDIVRGFLYIDGDNGDNTVHLSIVKSDFGKEYDLVRVEGDGKIVGEHPIWKVENGLVNRNFNAIEFEGKDGDDQFYTKTSMYLDVSGQEDHITLFLFGQKGNDILVGGDGRNYITGGSGADTIIGGTTRDVLRGGVSEFSSILFYVDDGLDGVDIIYGGDGDDQIEGAEGDDQIFGEDGQDVIVGGMGHDKINGGKGMDTIYGDYSPDDWQTSPALALVLGNDELTGGDDDDLIYGGHGNDRLDGALGHDTLYGDGPANGVGSVVSGADFITGGLGEDYIYGGNGADELYGNQVAVVQLIPETHSNFIWGGDGNDLL